MKHNSEITPLPRNEWSHYMGSTNYRRLGRIHARDIFISTEETEGISTLFTISWSGRPPTPISCSLQVTPTPHSEHGRRIQANTSHSWLTACPMVFPIIYCTLKKKRLHPRSPFTERNGQALFRATVTFTCTRRHNCISHPPRPGSGFH